jgi:hypothetical protein
MLPHILMLLDFAASAVTVTFVGASPCRLVNVEAETRTIIVAAENRIVEVSCP